MIRRLTPHVILRSAIILCVVLCSLKRIAFANPIDDVRTTVYAWADAWKSQNIIRYMSFYSPTFRAKELDYQSWLNKQAERFQKPANIQLEISDLWVFIEGKDATARFVQRYQDAGATEIGEKILLLVNVNSKWMIVSEEWTPLKPFAPPPKERSTVTERQPQDPTRQATDKGNGKEKKKRLHPDEIIVENVSFHSEKDVERVCFNLHEFTVPDLFTLKTATPRIVVDIKNVYAWKGDDARPVNGRLIKQIRTYLHPKIHKLRIVLDLNSAEDYILDKAYDSREKSYCIEVRPPTALK